MAVISKLRAKRKKPASRRDKAGHHASAADPFAPFQDWHKIDSAEILPEPWEDKPFTEHQRQAVAQNARLLLDRTAWHARVEAFQTALAAIEDRTVWKAKLAEFHIRFDRHGFPNGPDKDFSHYRFPCSVSFAGARFNDGNVSFAGARFSSGKVSFANVAFRNGKVQFDGAEFGDGDVSFDGARFGSGHVRFAGTWFGKGNVSFKNVHFDDGDVSFERVRFGDGHVLMSEASFGHSDISFVAAEFGRGNVLFNNVEFGDGNALFDNVRFGSGDVDFTETRFGEGNLSFANAIFSDGFLSFSKAVLVGRNFWFLPDSLHNVDFSAADLDTNKNLYVQGTFERDVSFIRLRVGGTASFANSVFSKVPDFRDAKFDRPPSVANMFVPRPKLVRRGWRRFKVAAQLGDAGKYRKLKAMALAANDHEKDGEFFAYEMLAKRGVEPTGFFPLLFNTLYHQLGNFGQSYIRPMAWMVASFIFFVAVYGAIIGPAGGWPHNFLFAIEYSFRNSVPLFGALFRTLPTPKNYIGWFDAMFGKLDATNVNMELIGWFGMAQAFFGGVLLFLLLLALRNKFRLK